MRKTIWVGLLALGLAAGMARAGDDENNGHNCLLRQARHWLQHRPEEERPDDQAALHDVAAELRLFCEERRIQEGEGAYEHTRAAAYRALGHLFGGLAGGIQ